MPPGKCPRGVANAGDIGREILARREARGQGEGFWKLDARGWRLDETSPKFWKIEARGEACSRGL